MLMQCHVLRGKGGFFHRYHQGMESCAIVPIQYLKDPKTTGLSYGFYRATIIVVHPNNDSTETKVYDTVVAIETNLTVRGWWREDLGCVVSGLAYEAKDNILASDLKRLWDEVKAGQHGALTRTLVGV